MSSGREPTYVRVDNLPLNSKVRTTMFDLMSASHGRKSESCCVVRSDNYLAAGDRFQKQTDVITGGQAILSTRPPDPDRS